MTPLKGFGDWPPLCEIKGVLKRVVESDELQPNGGSALNCSRTNCSIGL